MTLPLDPPGRRRAWLLLVLALHAAIALWLARQSAVAPPSQRTLAGLQAVIVPIAEPPSVQRAPSRTAGKEDVRRARPLEARPSADVGAVTAEAPAAVEAPQDREPAPAPAPLDLRYRGTGPREGAAVAVDAGRPGAGEPSAMAQRIEQSARADCREAYSGLGLLAAPLLLVDAVRKDGCKW